MNLSVTTSRLTLRERWTIARGSTTVAENVFVELEQDGVVGRGEAAPSARYGETVESTLETIEAARSLFAGADPWQFADLQQRVAALCEGQTAAKCALDTALMDWVTQRLGVPLYRFYGLDPQRMLVTSLSIGIDTPEVLERKIEAAAEFPILKIKLGGGNDEEVMATVRSMTGKVVRVDANEGWRTKEEAVDKINWLATQNVEFVEQPMPAEALEDLHWVKERVSLPIVADENVKTAADIPRLAGLFDGINIKLMKSGGVQEAMRMIHVARAVGLKIMLGCMVESSLAITAAAHLCPLVDWADLDGNLLISDDPYRGVRVEKGRLVLPDGPGLGVVARA
jgi:L-alanine-DL-glutamate epimerase-like enolase superfamily enzyme